MTVGVHTAASGELTLCAMLTTSANSTPWKNVASAGQPECEKPFLAPCAKWKRHRESASPLLSVGKSPGDTARLWPPGSGICATLPPGILLAHGRRKGSCGG